MKWSEIIAMIFCGVAFLVLMALLIHQQNEYRPPTGSETYYCLHGNSDCYTVGY